MNDSQKPSGALQKAVIASLAVLVPALATWLNSQVNRQQESAEVLRNEDALLHNTVSRNTELILNLMNRVYELEKRE